MARFNKYVLDVGLCLKWDLFLFLIFKGDMMPNDAGQSPVHYLEEAATHYATAIKFKPQNPKLHFLLGQTLEEWYYAEEMYDLKKVLYGGIFKNHISCCNS